MFKHVINYRIKLRKKNLDNDEINKKVEKFKKIYASKIIKYYMKKLLNEFRFIRCEDCGLDQYVHKNDIKHCDYDACVDSGCCTKYCCPFYCYAKMPCGCTSKIYSNSLEYYNGKVYCRKCDEYFRLGYTWYGLSTYKYNKKYGY